MWDPLRWEVTSKQARHPDCWLVYQSVYHCLETNTSNKGKFLACCPLIFVLLFLQWIFASCLIVLLFSVGRILGSEFSVLFFYLMFFLDEFFFNMNTRRSSDKCGCPEDGTRLRPGERLQVVLTAAAYVPHCQAWGRECKSPAIVLPFFLIFIYVPVSSYMQHLNYV